MADCLPGSHPVTRAFIEALTHMMFPYWTHGVFQWGVTVPLVTPPRPGRNTTIWSATAYSTGVLAYVAASLHIYMPSHYPPPVDMSG